jgi:hypothetical protein
LKHEEQQLPALGPAGGDPEDVLVYQAGYGERDQRGSNGPAGTARRLEGVLVEELLGGDVPSPPEVRRRGSHQRVVHEVKGHAADQPVGGGQRIRQQDHRRSHRRHFQDVFKGERHG